MLMKQMIKNARDVLLNVKSYILKKKHGITGSGYLRTRGFVSIQNEGKISMTGDVRINSGYRYNRINGYRNGVITVTKDAELVLGEDVGLSNLIVYCTNKITIGAHTMIGADTKIIDTDFHPTSAQDRMDKKNTLTRKAPVNIGSNVFIGMNCLILKGVTIGDNTVIAAGSVITKDVGTGEFVGSANMHSLQSREG